MVLTCGAGEVGERPRHSAKQPGRPGQVDRMEGAAMTKRFLYVAPIALAGVAFFGAPAAAAVWNGSMARDIATTTAEQTDSPLILVRGGRGGGGGGGGGGRGGGGYRGGGGGGARGGGSWAGAGGNRANFSGGNRANIS